MSARQRGLRKRAIRVWRALRAEHGAALSLGYVQVKRLVGRVGEARPGLDLEEVSEAVAGLISGGSHA